MANPLADFTYDTDTSVGQVRLRIADTDKSNFDFTDTELGVFLTMASSSVRRASAIALRSLASNRSRLAVRVGRGSVSEDLTAVAKDLREQAKALEEEADLYDGDGIAQAIISPSYERFSHQRNIDEGRHGNGPLDYDGYVDTVVTP